MTNKMRLDLFLVQKKLSKSRTHALALIMSGDVSDKNGHKLEKAGQLVATDREDIVVKQKCPWVSRAGLKLDKALKYFLVDPSGKICIDVGASTGGFTDVLVHNKAAKIYAVDVGYGQMDYNLSKHKDVIVMDKTNARTIDSTKIPDKIDLIVCDASFISLKKVLPASFKLGKKDLELIALIKPQFEVGKENVGKGGIITDPSLHKTVCEDIKLWLQNLGAEVLGITESPIFGAKGNKEFLIHAKFLSRIDT